MSRYMMLITHSEHYRDEPIPQPLLDAMGEFVGENLKSGVLIDTAGLGPTSKATRIRLSRGKLTATDGPFTETKEVIGGYAVIEARSREEAVELATKFMDLHRIHWPEFECACEVRAIEGEPTEAPASSPVSHAASV